MQVSPFLFRGKIKIMNESIAGPILTTDGIPLKVSLQKSERKNKSGVTKRKALILFLLSDF